MSDLNWKNKIFAKYVSILICQSIHLLASWFYASRYIITLTLLCYAYRTFTQSIICFEKFHSLHKQKQWLQMHSHVCMAELLYMKDFSQIEKKYRAAPAKYGTVGLIIWHSRSYNKSMITLGIQVATIIFYWYWSYTTMHMTHV